ncbi:4-hydroxy-tetrahydrodipicolinate synthase [Tindallia californiensis]|uniref:4-hydroxy-tetrahydrodipicolinate synthase n=1 Tax=Tindallia californiensis TaxID=159292 RepID=A0A1H3IFN8_9FIRM|nr:4-hydroxy-tetrahydrodipicolinate synthase [Tindallia californiensis]SDY26521.1 4-hydroxy-tetrahydrodipicolinate synthase [Tindallia californiensis]
MFKGTGVALITPFKEGEIDLESYKKLIDFQIKNDCQCLVVLGTTGEASTLTDEEKKQIITTAVDHVNRRIPVLVGTGSNNTSVAIDSSKKAEALGADGVLVVTPYYNKATQKGLITHFETIAKSIGIPLVLYNVPGRTGVNMEPETVEKLSQVKNIIGIKEASGNISQVLEIKRLVSEDFLIFSGNDDNILPIYSIGGHGVISVMANVIPKETEEMCRSFSEGNIKKAIELQVKYKKLFNHLFAEVNPIPVKAAMALMNKINNELRLPLTSMEDDKMNELEKEMKTLNII